MSKEIIPHFANKLMQEEIEKLKEENDKLNAIYKGAKRIEAENCRIKKEIDELRSCVENIKRHMEIVLPDKISRNMSVVWLTTSKCLKEIKNKCN
jgi:predicted nuclease with TOPRIM domain